MPLPRHGLSAFPSAACRRRMSSLALVAAVLTTSLALPRDAGAGDVDTRGSFQTSFYFGLGIDSFAASEVRQYLNPKASGAIEERATGGFDFAYRLAGSADPAAPSRSSVWVYGQTVHGVRSADLQYKGDSLAFFELTGYPNPGARTLYMLRNATSLEAFVGTRIEFGHLQMGTEYVAVPYGFYQVGFLSVAGLGEDVVDVNSGGLGVRCVNGGLADSFLEIGYGQTDLFARNRYRRWKVDGLLNWTIDAQKRTSLFTEMCVDADFDSGSDSVQSYIGFSFQLEEFMPK